MKDYSWQNERPEPEEAENPFNLDEALAGHVKSLEFHISQASFHLSILKKGLMKNE